MSLRTYNPPYALWSIWKQLSILDHGFVLILGVVFLYCLFSTVRTVLRVRSLGGRPKGCVGAVRERAAALIAGYAAVRQTIGAAFYLFGLVLFLGMENIGSTLGDSSEVIGSRILGNFILLSAFAANVFLVFLMLHFVQWFGNAALESLSRGLSPLGVSEGLTGTGRIDQGTFGGPKN